MQTTHVPPLREMEHPHAPHGVRRVGACVVKGQRGVQRETARRDRAADCRSLVDPDRAERRSRGTVTREMRMAARDEAHTPVLWRGIL